MKHISLSERIGMTEARNARVERRLIGNEAHIAALVERVARLEAALKTALRRPRPDDDPLPEREEINQSLLSSARMSEIAARVAAAYRLSMAEIRGPFRQARIAHPRQEAMRIMYEAGYSTPRIGRFFRRDHTTVLHGVRAARLRLARVDDCDTVEDSAPHLQMVAGNA